MKKRMNSILFLIMLALEFVVFVFGVLCASAGLESVGFGFVLLSYALMVCSYLMIKENTLCNSVIKIGLCIISVVWILGALLNAIDFTICCLIMIGEAITCYLLSKVLTKLTLKESVNEIKQIFAEIAKSKASNAADTMKDVSAKTSKAVKENVIPAVEHAKQKTDDLNEAVSKDVETTKKGIKDLSIKASNSIKEHADASKNSLKENLENSKNQRDRKKRIDKVEKKKEEAPYKLLSLAEAIERFTKNDQLSEHQKKVREFNLIDAKKRAFGIKEPLILLDKLGFPCKAYEKNEYENIREIVTNNYKASDFSVDLNSEKQCCIKRKDVNEYLIWVDPIPKESYLQLFYCTYFFSAKSENGIIQCPSSELIWVLCDLLYDLNQKERFFYNEILPEVKYGDVEIIPIGREVSVKKVEELSKNVVESGVYIFAEENAETISKMIELPISTYYRRIKICMNYDFLLSIDELLGFLPLVGQKLSLFLSKDNYGHSVIFAEGCNKKLGYLMTKHNKELLNLLETNSNYYAFLSEIDTINKSLYVDVAVIARSENHNEMIVISESERESNVYSNFLMRDALFDNGPFPNYGDLKDVIRKYVDTDFTVIEIPVVGLKYRESLEEHLYETGDWECFDKEFEEPYKKAFRYGFWFNVIKLEPEPDNPHDPDAIKVIADGFHIGYISKENCKKVHNYMKNNRTIMLGLTGWGGPFKYVDEDAVVHRGKKNFGSKLYFVNIY